MPFFKQRVSEHRIYEVDYVVEAEDIEEAKQLMEAGETVSETNEEMRDVTDRTPQGEIVACEKPEGKQEGQWTTKCPDCGKTDCLIVYKARLTANGRIIRPETPLTPDGFETDPNNDYAELKDHSTEDEKVQCKKCKSRFDLTDLSID